MKMIFLYIGLLFGCSISFAGELININKADAMQLSAALDGVGEKRAAKIIAWRQQYGPFSSLDSLASVPGIGAKLVKRNQAFILFKDVAGKQSELVDGVSGQLSLPSAAYR